MYVHRMPQQHCKSTKGCFDTYDNLLHKEYVPTHHHNVYFPESQNLVHHQQQQSPLLRQNEHNLSMDKNATNAMMNYNTGKSITLEIEKDSVPHVNIMNSCSDSKFSHEKTLLS